MAVTMEELALKVAVLEREVADLKVLATPRRADETAAERGRRIMAESRADQARIAALANEVFARMGIHGDPIPPEQLRQILLAEGHKPEDNLMSRGIREMREE